MFMYLFCCLVEAFGGCFTAISPFILTTLKRVLLSYFTGPYAGRGKGRMTIDDALIRKTLQSREWAPSGPSFHPASSFQPRPHGFLRVQREYVMRIVSPGAPGARTDQRTNTWGHVGTSGKKDFRGVHSGFSKPLGGLDSTCPLL